MFNFTQEELSFIAKQFGYDHLEGAAFVKFNKNKCSGSLIEKGYVIQYGKKLELSNECRLLLSSWESIRYTLVKDTCLSDENIHAILANSERIISYSLHQSDIQIAMCDFSAEVMDRIIIDYLNIVECNDCSSRFNVTFSADEYLSCFETEISNDTICKKTGLSLDDVSLIKQSLTSKNRTSFIVQDVVEDIGCMGVLVKHSEGYLLVKHIVPNNDIKNQKVVVSKGNTQDVIDSIYIL